MNETCASLVVAALEERAQQVKQEIERLQAAITANDAQGDPDLKQEHTYLLKHFNAYNKALFYWEKGIRPSQAPSGDWLIPSGSQGGATIHRVSRAGGVWVCGPSCKATAFHWHGALIEGLERAEELAMLHDNSPSLFEPHADCDDDPFLPTSSAAALGARLAQARARIAQDVGDWF